MEELKVAPAHDFARVLSLLRKERNLSQKQVSFDLGISQALLSHYEKGIRECSLTFLVKICDYYGVSSDYVLGLSPQPEGKIVNLSDFPENQPPENADMSKDSMPNMNVITFNRRIINNSINLLISMAQRSHSVTLVKCVCSYLLLSVYKLFRIIYNANPQNDQKLFRVLKVVANDSANSLISISEAYIKAASSGIVTDEGDAVTEFDTLYATTQTLTRDYPEYASSLLNLIKISEESIKTKSIKNG